MKPTTLLSLTLTLLLSFFSANAQSAPPDAYAADEFVVVYDGNTTDTDRSDLRALYGVSSYESLFFGEIELWYDLQFPITVQHPNNTITLFSVEDLEDDINTSNLGDSDPRARVSDGDFNYQIELHQDPAPVAFPDLPGAPTPFCPTEDYRYIGSQGSASSSVHIVIFDQVLNHPNLNGYIGQVIQVADRPGGTHANAVTWIIDHILSEAGSYQVNYTNIGAFGADGTASYVDLLVGFHHIQNLGIQNAIINFSANLTFADPDVFNGNALNKLVTTLLDNQNLILVSSAGNDANVQPNVFPGSFSLTNELTVVGTDRCFSNVWQNSNTNAQHYEIAADATNILTNNGEQFVQVNGTSYAAPIVSASLAQLSSHYSTFNPFQIQDQLLQNADQETGLQDYVIDGRVLNLTAAIPGGQSSLEASPGNLDHTTFGQQLGDGPAPKVYPNPFVQDLRIEVPQNLAADQVAQMSIRNLTGQLVFQASFYEYGNWSLANLPAGAYLLEIQVGENHYQQSIIKQ